MIEKTQTKGIVTGDFHWGIRNAKEVFQKTSRKFIQDFLIPLINEEDISDLFILGDLFHQRQSINVKILDMVFDLVDDLLSTGIDIHIITGNHDLYYKTSKSITSLRIFDYLNHNNQIHRYHTPEVIDLHGNRLYMVPWLQSNESKNKFPENLKKVKPDLCLGHFEINRFEIRSDFVEDDGFKQQLFKDNTKKTFSGHFHLRNEKGNITYVGTPYQTSWTDYGNTKGVYLLNFQTLRKKFIENKTAPIYQKLFASSILDDETEINLDEKAHNNFVKLIIDKNISEQKIQKLMATIHSHNPLTLKPVYDNTDFDSHDETCDQDMQSTPIELVQTYIQDVIDTPDGIEENKALRYLLNLYNEANDT